MPKPYDAVLKELIAASPDLSTVTAAADILLKTEGAVVHIEAQAGPDPGGFGGRDSRRDVPGPC